MVDSKWFRRGLPLFLAAFLSLSGLMAQGLGALGKYGPDGIPFTPDDPLEAKANVWGTKMSLSALHRYEHEPANEEAPDAQSTPQGEPFDASAVLLTSADFNFGYPGLELMAYPLHPVDPAARAADPGGLEGWKSLAAADNKNPSQLHDLSPVSAVLNNGENIEFSAPALGSVCWMNGVIPGQNEDATDFSSHLKLNWKPRVSGPTDARVMTEPAAVKSVRFVRMKNAHIWAQGACIFNLEDTNGGVALNTMFHFGFLGAAVQLNPDISELVAGFAEQADLKTKIKEGLEDKIGSLGASLVSSIIAKSAPELVEWLVESYEDKIWPLPEVRVKDLVPDEFKPMIRTLRRVMAYEWFEKIVAGDDLHLTLQKFSESGEIPPEAVQFAVDQGSMDAIVRASLEGKMEETTWLPWKDCSHPFQAASVDLSEVEKYFDSNREATALVALRDVYPSGFTWNRGSLYRTANLYVIGKRRDNKDVGGAGEHDWVELIEDVGAQMVTVRMTSIDPYRTRELMPGSVAGWDYYPTDGNTGWECFDLATLKKNGFNKMQMDAANKMLPVPWPFPNWAGGQGILMSCAAGGGHYSKTAPGTEATCQTRAGDEFLPREMLFYIGCYNPYAHPSGAGSFEYWGFRFTGIDGPMSDVSALNGATGEVIGFQRLWVSQNPTLMAPSGPIRFVDAVIANGHLDHVSPSRYPQATRQYQFLWDYDTDGTVDNSKIANTSHNFAGTSTTTLFTVDWDHDSYTGTGKTGMYQLPVFVN